MFTTELSTTQHALYNHLSLSATQVAKALPALVAATAVSPSGFTFRTVSTKLRPLSLVLRNCSSFQASTLVDLTVVDKAGCAGRFTVKYCFLSMSNNQRLIIELFASEVTLIPSLSAPFMRANRVFAAAG